MHRHHLNRRNCKSAVRHRFSPAVLFSCRRHLVCNRRVVTDFTLVPAADYKSTATRRPQAADHSANGKIIIPRTGDISFRTPPPVPEGQEQLGSGYQHHHRGKHGNPHIPFHDRENHPGQKKERRHYVERDTHGSGFLQDNKLPRLPQTVSCKILEHGVIKCKILRIFEPAYKK